jgi:hypothetical protein
LKRELQLEPAAYERAAAEQRGSRVLSIHQNLSTNPLPDGGGFFVLTQPLDGNN